MDTICNCFFRNNKIIKPITFSSQVSRDSLPTSPYWTNNNVNYENIDGQPDKELCDEKKIIFRRKIKNLLEKPKETHTFLIYQRKYGTISTYLELYVIMKQEKMFIPHRLN